MTLGSLNTDKTSDETRRDIRDVFRKWKHTVEEFEILPRAKNDSTATVEFWRGGKKTTLSCTRFRWEHNAYERNLRAVYLTLDALRMAHERGILRELAEAAAGFLEAPGAARPKRPWHEVLGVMPNADVEIIKAAFRATAKLVHPDAGGSDAAMAEVTEAYEAAKKEREFD